MTGAAAIFEGVWWVWLAWAAGVAVLARGAFTAARGFRRPSLAELARDEAGVSYSMSYVLVVPVYLFFLCMVFNASMILLAKVGTLYAAHAGARSAVVWQTAKPESVRQARIDQSVFTAMAPFVSASLRDAVTAGRIPSLATERQGEELYEAYTAYAAAGRNQPGLLRRPYPRQQATRGYILRKYNNAALRTTYTIDGDPNNPGGPCTVTVTYRSPIYFPGLNRFLTRTGGWPYTIEVKSVATIPNEAPATADHTLGIDYHSR